MCEDMTLINQSIDGWWKPRFLLDHRTQSAYEFMNFNEELVTVTDADIEWNTLEKLPEKIVRRAQNRNGHFPTLLFRFKHDEAEVEWQLNPDGRYYMNEDGYGMTDDREIALHGTINRTGHVVKRFRYNG